MAIQNQYPDLYFENYAIVCLNDLYNFDMILRKTKYDMDRPDLISRDEKIGIEVTRASSKKEGKTDSLFQRNYPKEERFEAIKEVVKKEKIKADIYEEHPAVLTIKDLDSKNVILQIKKSLQEKTDKLNSIYTIYPTNGLFIFTNGVFEEIELAVLCFYKFNTCPKNFDIIYVTDNEFLYIFEQGHFVGKKKIKKKLYKEKAMKMTWEHV